MVFPRERNSTSEEESLLADAPRSTAAQGDLCLEGTDLPAQGTDCAQDIRAEIQALTAPKSVAQRLERLYEFLKEFARPHVPGTPYVVEREGFLGDGASFLATRSAWYRALVQHDLSLCTLDVPWSNRETHIAGRTPEGFSLELYRDTDFTFSDDVGGLPVASASGFVLIDGEVWGSVRPISAHLGLHRRTVRKRVEAAGLDSVTGKISVGRPGAFFKLEDVRAACADLKGIEWELDASGFTVHEGVRWGTTHAWRNELAPNSGMRLRERLIGEGIVSRRARGHKGFPVDVYPEQDVWRVVEAMLSLPVLDAKGVALIDGRPYATVKSIAERLRLPWHILYRDLEKSPVVSVTARTPRGKSIAVYPEEEVRASSGHRAVDVPEVDDLGIVTLDGAEYAVLKALGRMLGISHNSILTRLETAGEQPKRARRSVRAVSVYSLEAARGLCRDLLEEMPAADEENIIMLDGIRHATTRGWTKIKGHRMSALIQRYQGTPSFKGRLRTGRIRDFYSEVEADRVIAAMRPRKA